MQQSKNGRRLLSSLLALSVCLSMAAPAVFAEDTPAGSSSKPTIHFSGDVSAWTPVAGESETLWLTAPGMAIDGQPTFALSGDLADQYQLENGVLTLKDGTTATNGTLTVSSTVTYYTADQLLWTDDSETDSSLTPSKTGKYALNHSTAKPHNGQKSLTTLPINSADGMWSPDIGAQQGTLVFYYYDPATELETSTETLSQREKFDQVKYGLAVNGYSDLLLGVAISSLSEGNNAGIDHLEYAGTYSYRVEGSWLRSNIARTPGWHKMEINVVDTGSTMKIDGQPVCAYGTTEPVVVGNTKAINKVAVATNWADKTEVVEFVQDKHFIDDIYILKTNAGDPVTETVTLNIQVQVADTDADAATVAAAKAAVESAFAAGTTVAQADAADQAAAKSWVTQKIAALSAMAGVEATVTAETFTAAAAGTLTNLTGTDGSYKFQVALKRNAAEATTVELTLTVTATQYVKKDFVLAFGEDADSVLQKGETGRVYLENMEDYAIAGVTYSTNNPNVTVSQDGTLALKPGYTPQAGETVTVTAQVTYYDPNGVVFVDSFEGEKKFTSGNAAGVYEHSDQGSLFGRRAATSVGSTNGYPAVNLQEVTDVTVTAWYYDANGGADQTKFGFSINGQGNALGIFYDGTIAAYVKDLTKTHYGARVSGVTYNNYSWGTTDVERSTGWHKFEWIIDDENGLTEKIDGKVISTNPYVGKTMTEADHVLAKVENNQNVKSLTSLTLMEGWNNNATNRSEISGRHFIDGVSVVRTGTATQTATLVSREIAIKDVEYTVTPATFAADSTYPEDQTLLVSPYVAGDTDVTAVKLDGTALESTLWSAGLGEAPLNAQNYPAELKGYQVTVNAEVFKSLTDGTHTLTLLTTAGSEIEIPFTAQANDHVGTDYYLSNNGDDNADGHTPETAWKTFEKLATVEFGPGDHIYLDATSIWSGVQFRPVGSGAPGAPVVLTKYNDGGDSSKRPILNGDGTVADFTKGYNYLAFTAWRKFYPSGTLELFGVEHWEVSGLEITNYKNTYEQGATGRNGIAIIYDYFEMGPDQLTVLPSGNAAMEEAFYRAGKLQHIYVTDCYIHDVTGYHPADGASGAGGKMSGGINAYGPYDDLKLDSNIIMYCDVEGIRNDVLAWMGDTRTQFPAYMEDISISNNYIVGVPGDGVVISSADKPILQNNYLTDAGYSYFSNGKNQELKAFGNRQDPRIVSQSTNFAGLWFIGTKDAVAQYNEAVNNVWTCQDGEAFDADMFCWGTVFQYNYTYRNNGGLCLFMSTMDDGTVVRYNVSIEDGEGVGSAAGKKATFYYNGAPEAIYNNLFVLGSNVKSVLGGSSNETYFYNNIVIKPSGEIGDFHLNGNGSSDSAAPALSGEIKNNLFYPAAILNDVTGSVVKADNLTPDSLDGVFKDLSAFLAAQPVKALAGRSSLTGDTVANLVDGKGAGVSLSAAAGRSIKTPTGGFDLSVFDGIRLADNSPAIGKGLAVSAMHSYSYQATNDAEWPLKTDFFRNSLASQTSVDIGPHQYSAHTHVFDRESTDDAYLKSAATCTDPAVYYFSCTCGAAGTATFTSGAALGHDLVHHNGKAPTDNESGWKAYDTCTRCPYTTYQAIAPLNHTHAFGEWKDEGDGTVHARLCGCGVKETQNHTWDSGKILRSPTASEAGERRFTCTVCGAHRTETLPATRAIPQTGDSLPLGMLTVLLLVSGSAAAALMLHRKKRGQ